MKELFTNMIKKTLAKTVHKSRMFSESVIVLQTSVLMYCSRIVAFPEQLSRCPVLLY